MRILETGGEQFARDSRYALRSLLRQPAFAVGAVLTLALGTGPNIAIFTVLYDAVLRPLPYADPDRLMHVERTVTTDSRGPRVVGFDSTFLDLASGGGPFESLARQAFTLTDGDEAGRFTGEIVSATYFPTLGVRPLSGRVFLDEEAGVAAFVVVGIPCVVQSVAQFTGTWELDLSRTVMYSSSTPRPYELDVSDTRTAVQVVERRGSGERRYSCTTDGSVAEQRTGAGDIYVRTVRREGGSLVWRVTMTRGADKASIDYTERWTVSEDGRTLTIHRVFPGARESLLVFARKAV